MKIMRVGTLAAAMLAIATVVAAQKPGAKPDFSGTWTLDAQASGMQPGSPAAAPLVVKHTPDRLVVERKASDGSTTTLTYRLDGTPSTNEVIMAAGVKTELKSVAKWEGNAVTISTSRGVGNPVVETWAMKEGALTIQAGPQKRVYRRTK
jgi:hypothetical protein